LPGALPSLSDKPRATVRRCGPAYLVIKIEIVFNRAAVCSRKCAPLRLSAVHFFLFSRLRACWSSTTHSAGRGATAPRWPRAPRITRDCAMPALLARCSHESQPPEQEKMAATKSAPVGQNDPLKSFLNGVSDANPSIIDRSAMWTTSREHSLQ